MNKFKLNIWRLHPKSSKVVKAEKTLNGTANENAVRFCRAYSSVNQLGFWMYSPIDMDIRWLGDNKFEINPLESFGNDDSLIVSSLIKSEDGVDSEKFCPISQGRTKFNAGIVEPNVVQLWTGCIFQTPPGFCIQIRNPINLLNNNFRVMEGILETDWMQYDIWINLIFEKQGELVQLRKEFPIAQLVPIRRESIDGDWAVGRDEIVNRNDEEADKVFKYWIDYNHKKFCLGGKQYLTQDRTKDATAFYKARAEAMGKGTENMEPIKDRLIIRPMLN